MGTGRPSRSAIVRTKYKYLRTEKNESVGIVSSSVWANQSSGAKEDKLVSGEKLTFFLLLFLVGPDLLNPFPCVCEVWVVVQLSHLSHQWYFLF